MISVILNLFVVADQNYKIALCGRLEGGEKTLPVDIISIF
jgi:hypothetical protein